MRLECETNRRRPLWPCRSSTGDVLRLCWKSTSSPLFGFGWIPSGPVVGFTGQSLNVSLRDWQFHFHQSPGTRSRYRYVFLLQFPEKLEGGSAPGNWEEETLAFVGWNKEKVPRPLTLYIPSCDFINCALALLCGTIYFNCRALLLFTLTFVSVLCFIL